MNPRLAKLHQRIFDISYKNKLSHLGSCITAVGIIDQIYQTKNKDEKFVLSCGHAGLALYVVLEDLYGYNAEDLLKQHGIHPCRDILHGIYCSSGSLGMGLSVAVGMAMAGNGVHCLISDGECAEGVAFEAMNAIYRHRLRMFVHVNDNRLSAYEESYPSAWSLLRGDRLLFRMRFHNTDFEPYGFLKGLDAHYHTLTKEEYESATSICRSFIR